MEIASGWKMLQGIAKFKNERRGEERRGGGRGRGGGCSGQDVVAEEDPIGHSQWGINSKKDDDNEELVKLMGFSTIL